MLARFSWQVSTPLFVLFFNLDARIPFAISHSAKFMIIYGAALHQTDQSAGVTEQGNAARLEKEFSFQINEKAVNCKLICAVKPWSGIKNTASRRKAQKHVQGRHCGCSALMLKPIWIHRILSRTFFKSPWHIYHSLKSYAIRQLCIGAGIVRDMLK